MKPMIHTAVKTTTVTGTQTAQNVRKDKYKNAITSIKEVMAKNPSSYCMSFT